MAFRRLFSTSSELSHLPWLLARVRGEIVIDLAVTLAEKL